MRRCRASGSAHAVRDGHAVAASRSAKTRVEPRVVRPRRQSGRAAWSAGALTAKRMAAVAPPATMVFGDQAALYAEVWQCYGAKNLSNLSSS